MKVECVSVGNLFRLFMHRLSVLARHCAAGNFTNMASEARFVTLPSRVSPSALPICFASSHIQCGHWTYRIGSDGIFQTSFSVLKSKGQNLILNMNDHGFVVCFKCERFDPRFAPSIVRLQRLMSFWPRRHLVSTSFRFSLQ
jgi:hypothetical protein